MGNSKSKTFHWWRINRENQAMFQTQTVTGWRHQDTRRREAPPRKNRHICLRSDAIYSAARSAAKEKIEMVKQIWGVKKIGCKKTSRPTGFHSRYVCRSRFILRAPLQYRDFLGSKAAFKNMACATQWFGRCSPLNNFTYTQGSETEVLYRPQYFPLQYCPLAAKRRLPMWLFEHWLQQRPKPRWCIGINNQI